jgi:hypothetical protein
MKPTLLIFVNIFLPNIVVHPMLPDDMDNAQRQRSQMSPSGQSRPNRHRAGTLEVEWEADVNPQ